MPGPLVPGKSPPARYLVTHSAPACKNMAILGNKERALRSTFYGLIFSLAALGVSDALAAGIPPAPAPDQRAYIAAKLYGDLQVHFAHWRDNEGLQFDDALRAYLAKATAAPDRLGFDLETIAFLAQFKGGRTGFSDRWLRETYPALPFAVRRIARDWVVSSSRIDALKPGDVIVQIDGTPTERFYQDHARFLDAGTDDARRAALFAMPSLFPSPLSLGLADGRTVDIDPAAATPAPPPEVTGKWLKPGEFAYIAIPNFDAPPGGAEPQSEARALELVKEYAAASTLVIDLRGTGGDALPAKLLAALMNRPYRGWATATPASFQPAVFQHALVSWPAPTAAAVPDAYSRQLILLIDGGCAGACEDFVVPFKDNGRAVLIGEPTRGRAGDAITEDLGDGMRGWISSSSVNFPNGAPLTAAGIAPDVTAAPGIPDLKTGLDPVIAKVLIQTGPGAHQDHRAP